MNGFLIQNATLVTMNRARDVVRGDLRVRDGLIAEIKPRIRPSPDEEAIDADGALVIPGLIQTHTHLCQTLFRGLADDMELLDWLRRRIWPLEHAHDARSLAASARLGLLEMQMGGTTAILDMGTTRFHDAVFAAAEESGIRYWGGNCLMDLKSGSGPLHHPTDFGIREARRLIRMWHRKTERLQYAVCPRFAVSCTESTLRAAVDLSDRHGLIFHTHASENRGEIALVKKRFKCRNIELFRRLGALGPRAVIAHGIHLTDSEINALAASGATITHCPSSNMKLASGFAPVPTLLSRGVRVSLGADGAPCNNTMDPFVEMRLASLIHKPAFGPRAMDARTVFAMATVNGAKALGVADRVGSIEVGKAADLAVVVTNRPSAVPASDPYSILVYSSTGRDVRDVWIGGRAVVREFAHRIWNKDQVLADAGEQAGQVARRARLKSAGR